MWIMIVHPAHADDAWYERHTRGDSSIENAPLSHLRALRLQDDTGPSEAEKARQRSRDDLYEQRKQAQRGGREVWRGLY